jgi:hypothetical protein
MKTKLILLSIVGLACSAFAQDQVTLSLPNGSSLVLTAQQKAGLDYAVTQANAAAKPIVTGTVTTQPTPISAEQYAQDRINDVLNSYASRVVDQIKADPTNQAILDAAAKNAAGMTPEERAAYTAKIQAVIESGGQ